MAAPVVFGRSSRQDGNFTHWKTPLLRPTPKADVNLKFARHCCGGYLIEPSDQRATPATQQESRRASGTRNLSQQRAPDV